MEKEKNRMGYSIEDQNRMGIGKEWENRERKKRRIALVWYIEYRIERETNNKGYINVGQHYNSTQFFISYIIISYISISFYILEDGDRVGIEWE